MSVRPPETSTPLIAALELTATEHPQLLPWLIDVVHSSPFRWMLHHLAVAWGVRPMDLGPVVAKAARDLDRLEARRGVWRHVRQVVHAPNLVSLHSVAVERRERVFADLRRRRLDSIARKVANDLEAERGRGWIERFIGVAASASPRSTSTKGALG